MSRGTRHGNGLEEVINEEFELAAVMHYDHASEGQGHDRGSSRGHGTNARDGATSTAAAPPSLPRVAALTLPISILGMLTCGTAYAFSSWDAKMQTMLGYSHTDIQLVGSFGESSGYFSPLIGLGVAFAEPSTTCLLASLFYAIGYATMAITLSLASSSPGSAGAAFASAFSPAASMAFFNLFASFGSALLYQVIFNVCVVNMPTRWTGRVSAILATMYGLCSSVFSAIYTHALHQELAAYFWLSAGVGISVAIGCAMLLRRYPHPSHTRNTAATPRPSALDVHLLDASVHVGANAFSYTAAECQQLADRSGLTLAQIDHLCDLDADDLAVADIEAEIDAANAVAAFLTPPVNDADSPRASSSSSSPVQLFQRMGRLMLAITRKRAFWLLCLYMFLLAGPGLFEINNMGDIVTAMNGGVPDPNLVTSLSLVLSMANGAGRLAMCVSDYLRVRRGAFLVLWGLVMTAAHTINYAYVRSKDDVIYGVLVSTIAYGGMWGTMPTVTVEAFGSSSIAITLGLEIFVWSLSSTLYNIASSRLYEQHVHPTPDAPDNTVCVEGAVCYRSSFAVMISSAVLATLVGAALYPHTKRGRKGGRIQALAALQEAVKPVKM